MSLVKENERLNNEINVIKGRSVQHRRCKSKGSNQTNTYEMKLQIEEDVRENEQ
jgi:hypothetical protein